MGPGTSALLAVKPEVAEAAARLVGALGVRRLLSVVGDLLGPARVGAARAHPGGAGHAQHPGAGGGRVTVISGGSHVTKEDLDWAEGLLRSVGTVLRLPERHLDVMKDEAFSQQDRTLRRYLHPELLIID